MPKPDAFLNGRPVYFGPIHFLNDFEDSYFESATFADTDQGLSDAELDQLRDANADYIGERWAEWVSDRRERHYEGDR